MEMTWGKVEEWLGKHVCHQRQKTGHCYCASCARVAKMMDSVCAIICGMPAEHTIEEIAKMVYSKTCATSKAHRNCNHKGCVAAEKVYDWLCEQADLMKIA